VKTASTGAMRVLISMGSVPGRMSVLVVAALLALAALGVAPAGAVPAPAAEAAAEIPTPSCAEGPTREGDVIVGTDCADRIVVPASVTYVDGGPGNDTIVAAPVTAASAAEACPTGHCGVGSQEFLGGPGNDTIFGERGNDKLRGGAGDDRLYGGIGDDLLEGGPGNDLLSGGFGADAIDGGEGSDFVRGDGTVDTIRDSGTAPGDVDTLSYATGATPGFGNSPPYTDLPAYPDFSGTHPGFPAAANGRGVYLDLTATTHGNGFNGGAPNGGGADNVAGADFERIIGTPFADYIVGSKPGQVIFGGGGGDVLISGGPGTQLIGGADNDDCIGESTATPCESTVADGPTSRAAPGEVEVGEMADGLSGQAELYLLGAESGSLNNSIAVGRTGAAPNETITFQRSGGAPFAVPAAGSGCTRAPSGLEVSCALVTPLDSLTLAGLGGADHLAAPGLAETTSLVLLGGEGNDELTAGALSDDTLVDGPGDDVLRGGAGDDALLNGPGRDELFGEGGNDLLISTVTCEADRIVGGPGRDNASWAKYAGSGGLGVEARLDLGRAGRPGAGGQIECAGGSEDELVEIEDLEGSPASDVLYGDAGPNQLLGHTGEDSYFAMAGEDSILANSKSRDAVIDCGADRDEAVIDLPAVGDPTPVECEEVRGAAPGEYEVPPELGPPETTPPPVVTPPITVTPPAPKKSPPPKPVDRTAPRTKLLRPPAKLIRVAPGHAATVVFRFAASERSTFECKLDARPYRRCRSPLRARLKLGAHVLRVFAVDAAGNRDRSPALARVRVVARHARR
jgi:Ca2+-binding RTX toxin-like protein